MNALLPDHDEVLRLSEHEAVQLHFDQRNAATLRRLLVILQGVAGVYVLTFLANGMPLRVALAAVNLILAVALHRARGREAVRRRITAALIGTLLTQFVFVHLYHIGDVEAALPWGIVFTVSVIWFRLAALEVLMLLGAFWTGTLLTVVLRAVAGGDAGFAWGPLVAQGTVALVVLAATAYFTSRSRRVFLASWRQQVERNRERLRMQEEIELARQVQLSMLPRQWPETGWLDIASVSLPATEVGGDFYDGLLLPGGELALVVADVAGHGVASGMVLSGVRSALYLLEDQLAAPDRVLQAMNRMVKRTSPRGMGVSVLVALLQGSASRLTVAVAGHPPVLHYVVSDGRVVEVGAGSPPLGALAEVTYGRVARDLAPGDVLLLHTDGLAEVMRGDGEQFGYERLRGLFARTAVGGDARGIRDAILRELWEFKGDTEQVDDVTLVVVRIASRLSPRGPSETVAS